MAEAANFHWRNKGHVVAFAADHGAHIDPSTGKGDHGLDIPEDMDVFHCYGIFAGEQKWRPGKNNAQLVERRNTPGYCALLAIFRCLGE